MAGVVVKKRDFQRWLKEHKDDEVGITSWLTWSPVCRYIMETEGADFVIAVERFCRCWWYSKDDSSAKFKKFWLPKWAYELNKVINEQYPGKPITGSQVLQIIRTNDELSKMQRKDASN